MVSFLFWNVGRNRVQQVVAALASQHEVDVLMLVELSVGPDLMLKALNPDGSSQYHYAPGIGCRKVQVFTRFSSEFVRPIHEKDRLTIRHLNLPGLTDILLAVTHFPSKFHWREESQAAECWELANSIRSAERRVGHSRTVLVGDLNMNPFESGLVSAPGLHAVMTRGIAQRGSRVVQAREYPFFYNPMWGLFGDATPGPPGTYYYSGSEHKVFFWNIFDQVLVRPDLLPLFGNEDLAILTSYGHTSLVTSGGLPDANTASDHLPVLFGLRL